MKAMMDVPNGVIRLDSEFAVYYGFRHDLFDADTVLVGITETRQVNMMMVVSSYPGQGNFSRAVKKMLGDGIRVAMVTPLPLMQEILVGWGFVNTWNEAERVEYWVYPPL